MITNVVIRESEVLRRVGLSTSTIRRLEAEGKFPKRMKMSHRAVGWWRHEIEEWLKSGGERWGK